MANTMNRNRGQDAMLAFTKQPFVEDVGPRRIKIIKFSMLSDADVLKMGEVQVFHSQCYVSQGNKIPVANGLLDPHMGPPNKFGTCETCHGDFQNCPGHFGCCMCVRIFMGMNRICWLRIAREFVDNVLFLHIIAGGRTCRLLKEDEKSETGPFEERNL